ncbi:mucin-binding protein, partial [Streptococcus sciuri]|nr:hypothetical protein [Streptococcus sciuri]
KTVPTSQTVTFEGAGDATPATDTQNDYSFSGKHDEVTGSDTWDEESHTYGKVTVPVVQGYVADKASAGEKEVTPANPDASDTVTYTAVGKLVPVDEDGQPITGAPTPNYSNNPDDPTKVNPTPVPSLDGWEPVDPSDVTPDNPTTDTPVKYRHKLTDISKATSQTVTFEGAGDATPATDTQNDYSFSGKHDEVTGSDTWDEE